MTPWHASGRADTVNAMITLTQGGPLATAMLALNKPGPELTTADVAAIMRVLLAKKDVSVTVITGGIEQGLTESGAQPSSQAAQQQIQPTKIVLVGPTGQQAEYPYNPVSEQQLMARNLTRTQCGDAVYFSRGPLPANYGGSAPRTPQGLDLGSPAGAQNLPVPAGLGQQGFGPVQGNPRQDSTVVFGQPVPPAGSVPDDREVPLFNKLNRPTGRNIRVSKARQDGLKEVMNGAVLAGYKEK